MLKILSNKKRFKLLTIFLAVLFIKTLSLIKNKYTIINRIKNESLFIEIEDTYMKFSKNDQALISCLSILYENNVFLIKNKFFKISNNRKILDGKFDENLKKFNQNLIQHFNKTCILIFINKTQSSYLKLLTGIYVNCSSFSVQISIFYRRNHFYWVGFADKDFEFFGDLDRAFNK